MALIHMNNALVTFQCGARKGPVFITQCSALGDTQKYMAQICLFWSLYKSSAVIQLAELPSPAHYTQDLPKIHLLSNIFDNESIQLYKMLIYFC